MFSRHEGASFYITNWINLYLSFSVYDFMVYFMLYFSEKLFSDLKELEREREREIEKWDSICVTFWFFLFSSSFRFTPETLKFEINNKKK